MLQLDWNATINSIRETVPPGQFQTWFKPLEYLRSNENSIVLGVPSKFHEDWLRSNYGQRITQAIRNQCGAEVQLEFEILVRDENYEASLSDEPAATNVALPAARPSLRVITSNDLSTEETQEPGPARTDAPNLPPFSSPFLELGFNHIAYQFANLFAEGKEMQLGPIIFLAGVGMGKTHLLSEIGTRIYAANPKMRIRYTNSVSFTAEMVSSIKNNTIHSFQEKYRRETDVLLFDDLPGIAGRKRTEEELLHIFNEVTARGGRIAFSSSVPVHRIEGFVDPALKSRLSSALVAEIRQPTFEEKIQMLSLVSMQNQILVEESVLRTMAERGQADIRELLGCLFRIHLQSKLLNQPLDRDFLAKEGLVRETHKEVITIEEIIALVENYFGIDRNEMMSKSRKNVTTWARQVAMFLARHYTLMPLEEIGKTFGRDHSTVIHAFQKVTETMEAHAPRKYEVEFLKQKLQNRSPRGSNAFPL